MTNTLSRISRRGVLKNAGALAAAASAGALPRVAFAAPKTLKIGFVTPQTGPLAIFAEPDAFTLAQVKKVIGDGLMINGTKHPVEIVVKDSQSSSNRASEVASELILNDKVDLILATSTPDTTNPVADQAELNGVPCITNDTPWQPHFFGRSGDPAKGFQWTNHFFWGLEDIISVYTSMWAKVPGATTVGALWPNDPDGNAWGDPERGFPPVLAKKGLKLVDPGRFQSMSDNFTAQISAFKAGGADIITGVIIPPDLATFWSQAAQQGLKPKVVTIAKASEFPQAMAALGDRAENLSVEVWWSPGHPFASGMTGQSSAELAAEYEKSTGAPWTMPLGFKHSLFEVALDVLKRAEDPTSAESVQKAAKATSYASIVGPIDFSKGPVPNIAKTPLVGGQWQKEGGKLVLKVVENSDHPNIPLNGEMKPLA
jgi:branched-chain amino acid transport system substrate-binding protein